MARQQQDVDELFDIKNAFYIGNYQQCVVEAQKFKPSNADLALERDAFLYRAYIAQKKYKVVLYEMKNSKNQNAKLLPLKTLAEFFSEPNRHDEIVASIEEKVSKGVELSNDLFVITAATIYYHQNNLEGALRVLHGADSLEALAYSLQILLALNRPDLARKHLKLMQDKDDDATLTQLAQAWLLLVQGGAKLQDAYYIYQELCDKFPSSGMLGCGLAVAQAGRGSWPEAEAAAMEAMSNDPAGLDLLLLAGACSQQLGKPKDETDRYMNQLMNSEEKHQFVTDFNAKMEEFDRLQKQYKPSKTIAECEA